MIESVSIVNDDRGIQETLTLNSASKGIMVTDIDGLGPVAAQLNTTPKASGDGVNYNSKHVGARNIVLSLDMLESGSDTIENIRQRTYEYFPTGEEIELIVTSGAIQRQIYGRVESNVPKIFTKSPSSQISIMCEDPYFAEYPNTVNNAVIPAGGSQVVAYPGQVNNGMLITFQVKDSGVANLSGHITLLQQTPGQPDRGIRIEDFNISQITQARLQPGDLIQVNTVRGHKSAKLIRNGVTYNIMGALVANNESGYFPTEDQWPLFQVRKQSTFSYTSTNYDPSQLIVSVNWSSLYEGL